MEATPSRDESGAVLRAFLLSDIRGFSTFASVRGDVATGALIARFADIARQVLPSHGGEIIGQAGDEVVVAFESPRAAIRGAIAFQARLLEATRENPSLPLPAGIGLDFGEAIVSDAGWAANAINVAARLCAVAAGGEILATEHLTHVAQVVDGVTYVARTPVALKGIEQPVRHVRVVAVDLDTASELKALGFARAAQDPLPPRRDSRVPILAVLLALVLATAGVVVGVKNGSGNHLAKIGSNSVGALSVGSGKLQRSVQIGGFPGAVAADADSVWVVSTTGDSVSRIDSRDDQAPAQSVAVGSEPSGVAIGDGAVWVTNAGDRTLSRINPGLPLTVGDTTTVGNDPSAVAVGYGRVWVANAIDDTVSVVNPAATAGASPDAVQTTVPVGAQPSAIATGFNSVWIANEGSSSVSRLDPKTMQVTASIQVGNGPDAITSAPSGIWVTNVLDNTVSHIDPSRNAVASTVTVGSKPGGVAASGGDVWVTNSNSNSVSEIDADSNQVEKTISVGVAPQAVAIAGGSVWISASGSSAEHRGGAFKIIAGDTGVNDNPLSFDPAVAYLQFEQTIVASMNDGLVAFRKTAGPDGSTIVPDMATQIPSPTSDGTTYSFQLRPGLRFSTGEPVRASDFRASMERVFDIGLAPPYYSGIEGAAACAAKSSKPCDLSQGIVTDDSSGSITIHLTKPDPELMYKLALPFADVLPASTPDRDLRFSPHPTTGPYEIAQGGTLSHVVLDRNPNFRIWSSAAQPDGYPDHIVIDTVKSPNGSAADRDIAAVAAGRYDWSPDVVSPKELDAIDHTQTGQLHPYTTNSVNYFFLNTRKPPFDNVAVRRAVNFAVDRRAAVSVFGGPLLALPTCQALPPSLFGYRPYCPYTILPSAAGQWSGPNLVLARQLIRSAHAEGAHVDVIGSAEDPGAPAFIARTLRSIGLDATSRVYPAAKDYYGYVGAVAHGVQIGSEGWAVDYPEASNLFVPLLRCSDFTATENYDESGFCNEQVDQQMDHALQLQETDPSSAGELWSQIDHEVVDDAPWVPLTNARQYDVLSPRVGDYEHQSEFGFLVDQAWVR